MDWHSDQSDEQLETLLRQFQPPAPPGLRMPPMNVGWMVVAAGIAAASAAPIWWVWSSATTTAPATVPGIVTPPTTAPRLGRSTSDRPLLVGVDIQTPPQKIYSVDPIYPDDARANEIDGVVILHITIANDGSVRNVQVVKSIPLLDDAAVDAVSQWQDMPTLLNGEAVEVEMDVIVRFTLT